MAKKTGKKTGSKKAGKKKSGRKKTTAAAAKAEKKKVSMKKARNELDAVLDEIKTETSPEANDLRATIMQFNADTDCGQTLFIEV